MKSIALLCILALLVGCISADQTQAPPQGDFTIHLGTPAEGIASGPVILVTGCQVSYITKSVPFDVLNPAVSAATALQSPSAAPVSGPATTKAPPEKVKPEKVAQEKAKQKATVKQSLRVAPAKPVLDDQPPTAAGPTGEEDPAATGGG